MGRNGIVQLAAAGTGAAISAAGFTLAGAPWLIAGAAALLGGAGAYAMVSAVIATSGRKAAEARFDTLAQEMVAIREAMAAQEQKLAEVEKRSAESPALIWRAATADIQVLGTLVSELARTVADHDARLAETPAAATPKPQFHLPQTMPPPPSWFESESDLPEAKPAPEPPPAAVPRPVIIAELKSTLATALMSDRLELCLQPYVTLPQRKVTGYEASLSLKAGSGELQGAEELRAAASAAGMTLDLDRMLMERTGHILRVLRSRDRVVPVTCSINGASMSDAGFRSAVEAVARGEGKLAQNITLAVPADDLARLWASDRQAVDAIRRTGVTLAASSPATRIDVAMLEASGIAMLRMPAAALLGRAGAILSDIHPADLGEMLQRRNIRLLVTGVDDEATVRDLLDIDAALAQGELFGPARPVRPEVLQPRAVSETEVQRPTAERPAKPQPRVVERQSFRSFLRRA